MDTVRILGQAIHPTASIDMNRHKQDFQTVVSNELNGSVLERSLCKRQIAGSIWPYPDKEKTFNTYDFM